MKIDLRPFLVLATLISSGYWAYMIFHYWSKALELQWQETWWSSDVLARMLSTLETLGMVATLCFCVSFIMLLLIVHILYKPTLTFERRDNV